MEAMMEEPLAQFLIWWDSEDGKQRAVDEQESVYRIAQRAFFAGHATQPPVPLEASRDALTAPRSSLKSVARPYFVPKEGETVRFLHEPAPDYVQRATVTGRFPQRVPAPPLQPLPGPVAGPPIEVLQRVQQGIQDRIDAGEPLPRPAPAPYVHTQTVWEAPESPDTLQFRAIEPDEDEYGPRGPVFTPLSGQDG